MGRKPRIRPAVAPAALAKTSRPSVSDVLPRERLFTLLDEARRGPAIWVTGPPGAGKTTLVASYIDRFQPQCLWYQLDAADSDIATFFYYMGLAARQCNPRKTRQLPPLTPEYRADLSTFTRRYFQKLYQFLREAFVLVFDGYHEISPQSALHQAFAYALAEIPAQGCVIFISRGDPPITMARLRANRALETLGWNDLKLTREESDAIVELQGLKLPEPALNQLYEKTQGWAAGLVLMLEQAKTGNAIAEAPALPASQLVFDYLAGEIFLQFDAATQDFLLRTAFLPQMTPRLARDLTGNAGTESILTRLIRDSHFVTLRHGVRDPIFQYHPLLKEFLVSRARETLAEDEYKSLQRKAAALLESSGELNEAAAILASIGDWNDLARLILQQAADMLEHGRGETLSGWLEDLPDEVRNRDPWLLYWLGMCRFQTAPRESRHLFEQAFELFNAANPPDVAGLYLACSGTMEAILHEMDDLALLDRWIANLIDLLGQYPEFPGQDIETLVISSMFKSLLMRQPQHPDIETWAERALAMSRNRSNVNLRMSVELFVALFYTWTAQFDQAKVVIDSMQALGKSPEVSPLALTTLRTVESMYYMWMAQPGPCLNAVYSGLEIAQSTGVHILSNEMLTNGIAVCLGAGDLETADKLLSEFTSRLETASRLDRCFYYYLSAWNAVLRRDMLAAFQHQQTALNLAIAVGSPFIEVLCRLASAQVLFECGEKRKAIAQLRYVHSIARHINNSMLQYMYLLTETYFALEQGNEQSGVNILRHAMAIGSEHGFVHFLWWRPNIMAKLCARALDKDIEAAYVLNLIRQRSLISETSTADADIWPWDFKIYTLGQFKVVREGTPIPELTTRQRKPMELLKALVAFGGRNVPEDHLAELLWPRIDADYAQRSLTTALHRLRKLLGQDKTIVLQDGRLSLNETHVWLDIWALDHVLGEVDSLFKIPRKDQTADKVSRLTEKAFHLFRGPFMAGEAEHPWYVNARERLRNKFLRCMGEIARYWEETGAWDIAIDCYQRGLEADQLAEGFYRRLMLCYRQLGRNAEAIEVYNRCRKTLEAALHIEPSPETRAIYASIQQTV